MAIAIVLVLMVVGSIIFNFWSPWWFTPLASNWKEMDDTLIITLWITGFVFVAINFFIAYAVIRFRYSKERRAAYEPENTKLEWWLTVLTSVGVVAMLAPGLWVYAKFVNVPEGASVVEAVGQQWKWTFRFPGEDGLLGTVDPRKVGFDNPFGMNPDDPNGQDDILVNSSEVHLPIDRPVKFVLRSKDVLHDFYVPNFRVKMDLVPGSITSLWFTPTVVGGYDIACAEYCGVGHHGMRGRVIVDEEAGFQEWLGAQPTYAQTLDKAASGSVNPLVKRGEELAQEHACLSCHSLDGIPSLGPTWKDLYEKTETLVDGSTVLVDKDYLKESITDPNAKIVEEFAPTMPPYDLSDEDLDALIAYMIAKSSGDDGATKSGGDDSASSASPVEQGEQLAREQGCIGCHTIDGGKSIGPTWKGLFGKTETLVDDSTVVVDEAYLKESIVDPNVSVIKGYSPVMPPYPLSDAELDALVEYTKSLSQ